MTDELREGQIVLCTVEKIIGTTVFVRIENDGEGTITTSEIAPGRIRNLRDYVVPGKKIICKILRVRQNQVHLSLRRVKSSERKGFLEGIKKEKSYRAILSTVLKEEFQKTLEKIKQKYSILDFIEEMKESSKIAEEYLTREQAEKILKILESKKEKPKEIRQIFRLSNNSPNGIIIVKDILQDSCKGTKCLIKYLAAGRYSLSIIGEDFKEIKNEVNKTLTNIELGAKKQSSDFLMEKG